MAAKAGRRVDEITTQRFNRWGDWRLYYTPKQWFRRGEHVFFLRGGSAQEGFGDVAILTLTPEFKLRVALDAEADVPAAGDALGAHGRGGAHLLGGWPHRGAAAAEAEYELGVAAHSFRIRPGRPEQMRSAELREQIVARAEVGLRLGPVRAGAAQPVRLPGGGACPRRCSRWGWRCGPTGEDT